MMFAMKIVTYNIQYGRGKDGRFDLERIAEEIGGADLIALQESPQRLARDAKALGCASVALPPGVCSPVCTDQVDPLVVDHGRTPGRAHCWGYG